VTTHAGRPVIWQDRRGAGDPVLLIHGGLFDPMDGARFWIAPGVADDLAAGGYLAITPDRCFSSGRTSAPFDVHSWDVEAADMATALADAGVERAHVVAGSNGVSVALRLAATRPATVRSLVLGWPVAPDNAALELAFERAARAIKRDGGGPAARIARARPDAGRGRGAGP
jgi:pimeloyl-ACP methyl ester carboxylesterase